MENFFLVYKGLLSLVLRRCKRNCLSNFSSAAKEGLLQNFNSIGESRAQDMCLVRGITAMNVKRRRPVKIPAKTQRSHQYQYKVIGF